MKSVSDLRVQIFADGADKASMLDLYRQPHIKGFTTNPTLMRATGVTDYQGFALDVLATIQDRPISFEVFADEEPEMEEQARHIGDAWEKLPDPKPQFNLEIHLANGDKTYKVLGPHAPNLTGNEVNLLHRLWLRFSEAAAPLELHHHDVVHFALEEVMKELDDGQEEALMARLKAHLEANAKKKPPQL